MRRRRFLQALTAGVTGAIAGCLSGTDSTTPQPEATAPTPATGTPASAATGVGEPELPVPLTEMRHTLPRDYIPAITDPAFAEDWRGLEAPVEDPTLPGETPVLGVQRDDRARAYPLRVLNHHEIVNDDFAGPIAVTYCVLCGTGVVVERRVAGEPTVFGVSGKLWRSDLVMYDRSTESLWSQLMATAIRGERTGDQLTILPSTLTTWAEWRRTHPETRVLLPPPHSTAISEYDREFDYFAPAYGYGEETQLIGLDSFDGKLHPKTMVVGVSADGRARAYPFPVVTERGVVNDRIGDLPVVVAPSPDGTLVAYDRRIDGRPYQFEAGDDRHLVAAGSRWRRTTGEAVDGPHEGRTLAAANDHPPMFWLGWSKFNPESEVFGSPGGQNS
jgi:hypothetical protein